MKKLLLLIVACLLTSPVFAQQDTVVEEIVARINNSIITRADLRRNQEQMAQDAREGSLSSKDQQEREANALRDLIDQQLLLQKAADLGITAEADLVKRLDDIRKDMKAGSLEELQKAAEAQGVSWEEFKSNTKNNILTQKVIGSEVGSHVQVTREEATKFYEEHKAEISQPERVRLSEILIATQPNLPKPEAGKADKLAPEATPEQVAAAEAHAQQLYEQLKGGAKFDELARKESNGPTAEQGGDLGYFKRKDLAKELEDKAFALQSGGFTEPIRTRQGFLILRVNDHIEAGTPPFERVREQIQEQLYTQKIQPALREFLTRLREEAYIDIKPGYTDSGASPNQTKLIYTTETGPKTKQVRGKLGVGKKKTIVVTKETKKDKAASDSTSALGQAKADVDAKAKAEADRQAAAEKAAAKTKADAEEKAKISKMSPKERKKYVAARKRAEKKEARSDSKETRKEKKLAAKTARKKAAKDAAKKNSSQQKPEEADPNAPPKKKKGVSWF
jgi:peptidyl-prolyl cis-trans isomerase SurA